MKQFDITGMSCAACSARIEKAVSKLEGVESCSVSLLTNSMGVSGTASEKDIINAVKKAGYGASVKGTEKADTAGNSYSNDELSVMKGRLFSSLGFLAVLMYVSMGHTMLGLPLPDFFHGNYIALGLLQLLLAAIVMVINQKFFINGFKGLINRSPNMDTLVALGSAASFGYSTYALFAMTADLVNGAHYLHELYFESAAMILALITLGKMLETRSKGKTTDALKGLMKLSPETAVVVRDDTETIIPIEQLNTGDIFIVRPGDSIPADGVVTEGISAVNEASLTGESVPVDKTVGDTVSAATLNQSGVLKCRAERVGKDTTLSRIIKLVEDSAATKAPIAKISDKVSGVFVPVVIGIALITTAIWLIMGQSAGFALARGISVLVISCPCALGLATPVAIMVGNGIGAKNGILFKTAVALEKMGQVSTVVLDKTGTITEGKPVVTDIIPSDSISSNRLLSIAYSLEYNSEHPLGKAIAAYGSENRIPLTQVTDFEILPGNGLKALIDNCEYYAGNLSFISTKAKISGSLREKAEKLADEGKTPLFFCSKKELLGIIAVADAIKPDSAQAIAELKNMGAHVVMVTGDNEKTAKAIGSQAGVDEVVAGVLPDGKSKVISALKEKGSVAMVGDGINDAPALTVADVGIAIGAGSDIAIDAAEVVLINSRLSDVSAAMRLSRATLRTIHQNLFWAFFYNIIGIPLAAGVFISAFGWQLNPMFGAAAMSLSSFCVVSNALRLNLIDIHNSKKDIKIKPKTKKEKKAMKKTMKIEGMMCGHCEASVKKALEALDSVAEAAVSHTDGTAVVTLKAEISDDELRKAVEAKDYTVISIEG